MRTLDREGSTTSESDTGVSRSAMPMSAVNEAKRSNPSAPANKQAPLAGVFLLAIGGDEENPRQRGFDYKRKRYGCIAVGYADERSERSTAK